MLQFLRQPLGIGLVSLFSLVFLVLPPAPLGAQAMDPLIAQSDAIFIIFRAADFAILDANPAAERFYGYSRAEFQQMNIADISAAPAEIKEPLRATFESGVNVFQIPHRLADGSIREVEIFSTPSNRLGMEIFTAIIHDVTARVAAERELEAASSRLKRAELISRVGNWEFNAEKDKISLSEGAQLVLQTTAPSINRKEFIELARPEQRSKLSQAFARLAKGVSSIQVDFQLEKLVNGSTVSVHFDASYDLASGQSFGIVQDISSSENFIEELHITYRFIFALGLVLILVLTFALINFLRLSEQRRKDEIAIRQLLNEKTVLLKEVHHRIKNHMSSAIGLLSLQADQSYEMPAAKAGQMLEEAAGRLRSVMVLYDKLYRSEDFENLSTVDYFQSLLEQIEAILPSANRIRLDYTQIDRADLEPQQLSTLGIILNEAVTNAFKYAYASDKSGIVKVSFIVDGEFLRLTIADKGRGMSATELQESEGFGLQLIRILAEQLHGRIDIDLGEGMKVMLVAPLQDVDLPLPENGN